jgi:futalosine hydrolase
MEIACCLPDGVALADGENLVQSEDICWAVTGVGVVETLLKLSSLLSTLWPKRVLNVGIAGAYPGSGLAIGALVVADSETFGDVGFELPVEPGFQPISSAPFGTFYAQPLALTVDERLFAGTPAPVRVARGCTVSTCTGTRATGMLRERLYEAAFETMEGAAVAAACAAANMEMCEVRAISNIAAERDMRWENIQTALASLRHWYRAYTNAGEAV